jgi:hypothetical protein
VIRRVARLSFPLAAFVLILAVSFGFEHAFSPTFKQCIAQHEHDEATGSDNKYPAGFSVAIGANVRCSGEFFNSNGSGITALATFIIAAFTGTLWITTTRQARLTKESVDIASKTLILANRPRIKVRTFVIKPRNQFVWNLAIDVECQVVNSGGVDAYIVESNCTVYATGGGAEGLPMLPPYSNQTDSFQVKDNILPAGLACPLYQRSDVMLLSKNDEFVLKGEIKLYTIGYVLYRDELHNFYRTAFCRRFNFQKKRFEIVHNQDYEHQD